MEAKKVMIAFLMLFVLASGFGQEISRKAQREKSRVEKRQLIEKLINSKEFVFIANRANPQGGASIDLTTNSNSIEFHPEKIKSYMPFFGRAYSIDYGGDGGIKFEGKPKEFRVLTKEGGKGYEIYATVPVTRDNYQLTLFVSPEGSATMNISSNQRSPISYNGNIEKFEAPEEK